MHFALLSDCLSRSPSDATVYTCRRIWSRFSTVGVLWLSHQELVGCLSRLFITAYQRSPPSGKYSRGNSSWKVWASKCFQNTSNSAAAGDCIPSCNSQSRSSFRAACKRRVSNEIDCRNGTNVCAFRFRLSPCIRCTSASEIG